MLLGNKLNKEKLLKAAMVGEYSVSGGYFADNVAPAIYGGATLTRSIDPLHITPIGTISDLIIILAIPDIQLLTRKSRQVIPSKVELSDCIHNMANTASITAAFCKDDYTLLKDNLYDFIIEPRRAKLIPGFTDVKEAALNAGAHGMTISGSGPAVFAITNIEDDAKLIDSAMAKAFQDNGIKCQTLITKPSADGAKII
jgi:homoserine kinase